MDKKIIIIGAVLLAVVIGLVLIFSGGGSLSGTYVSESGKFTIEFKRSGECTWHEDGFFFTGTYEKNKNGYRLLIQGSGLVPSTSFEAVKDGKALIITGGIVYGERFVKQ